MIGDPEVAEGLSREIAAAKIRGYRVLGLDLRRWPTSRRSSPLAFPTSARSRGLRRIVAAPTRSNCSSTRRARAGRSLASTSSKGVGAACLDLPVRLIEASQFYEELLGHVPVGQINAAWFQYIMHPRYRRTPTISKRLFDFAIGSVVAGRRSRR